MSSPSAVGSHSPGWISPMYWLMLELLRCPAEASSPSGRLPLTSPSPRTIPAIGEGSISPVRTSKTRTSVNAKKVLGSGTHRKRFIEVINERCFHLTIPSSDACFDNISNVRFQKLALGFAALLTLGGCLPPGLFPLALGQLAPREGRGRGALPHQLERHPVPPDARARQAGGDGRAAHKDFGSGFHGVVRLRESTSATQSGIESIRSRSLNFPCTECNGVFVCNRLRRSVIRISVQ